jgi:hypothetical protein
MIQKRPVLVCRVEIGKGWTPFGRFLGNALDGVCDVEGFSETRRMVYAMWKVSRKRVG